jgi:hypothetical protein
VLAKFDAVCLRMPQIAVAIESFADPTIRERAYYELVGILNPTPDDGASGFWVRGDDLDRLTAWIADQAPMAWRDSVQPSEATADALIRFLEQGAAAWTQMLLVKHALMTAGGFSAEQVDGDLAPLIRDLAADPPVSSPEIEALAAHLRAEAQPGETAPQVALRLIERLRQGRPMLIPTPEVQQVADGVHTDTEQVDDRGGEPEKQPDDIAAAIRAYRQRTGTS